MKLDDKDTQALRLAHRNLVEATFKAQAAELELNRVRQQILMRYDLWGQTFNDDYTETVNGDQGNKG